LEEKEKHIDQSLGFGDSIAWIG